MHRIEEVGRMSRGKKKGTAVPCLYGNAEAAMQFG
jgi:hypothetical protein